MCSSYRQHCGLPKKEDVTLANKEGAFKSHDMGEGAIETLMYLT